MSQFSEAERFNPFTPVATKSGLLIMVIMFSWKHILEKKIQGEMFFRPQSTFLLQKNSTLMLYNKIIFKNVLDPDDTFHEAHGSIF